MKVIDCIHAKANGIFAVKHISTWTSSDLTQKILTRGIETFSCRCSILYPSGSSFGESGTHLHLTFPRIYIIPQSVAVFTIRIQGTSFPWKSRDRIKNSKVYKDVRIHKTARLGVCFVHEYIYNCLLELRKASRLVRAVLLYINIHLQGLWNDNRQ